MSILGNNMRLKHSFIMLTVTSMLAGCAVGPDYIPPKLSTPNHFYGQNSVGKQETTIDAQLDVWWEKFGDAQLTHYIAIALDQNLDLAQATARLAQARAGLGAANAALLPSGSISGQAARAYQSVETPLGQILNSSPSFDRYGSSYETNLNASWELDLFGGLRRDREAALAEYQATSAGIAATRLAVAAQTASIYVNIRAIQARLDIARKQVETQQQMLDMINLLYSKGLVPERQVHQTQAMLAQYQATVPLMEASLETTMNALDVILGTLPGSHRAELTAIVPLPSIPNTINMGTPGELLTRRPDLIIAERHLAASNAKIGVAIAEYYPKFSLSGLLGSATSITEGNLFSNAANQAAGVIGLRWRLFDFGRIDAQIAQAKGREAEMLAAYRLAVLKATEDVENTFSTLAKREQQTEIVSQGVDAIQHARNASFSAYQKGIASKLEVLQADESLLRASDEETLAIAETITSAIAAYKALGGGWEADENTP
ncbi:efflux transporter outer membrane subunit [Shewanella sp. MM_2022_3]|uniref:efflux transporter outer membrane subunit n=1 Tax=Shewanella sp. MM_2022_3 TaxID=2923280 RepID=UPI001F4BE259|nr:efflux transporter outer membrane subunit [Shewanella sp. MM_2022_3]MCH7422553.1 efflux transporter outer membrane subunit [Shewanella sp. MM_2022_3]